ncbi:Peptidylprolyl isomerase D (Cyclophilin D),related [Neospora caninum Liverpool]|uniref:peptidylprolyl isomerase n=2 Tax=Sarcocystidae TaxID=5809 RepID=F0VHA5_NEOCL|nr:Peptidylprolyl isomerase D (Cyclophilin D),related [Neospora caninum Liverpool]CBZ53099.1 Peptidylprolyl isomerase D (Cyclophilin D),related [Neospora caninum Liverpool]CEL67084.1 TPA: Peptidylprolyl isomerase D (Cyclophilin D),related [Neospora caninum Liverpool]|eukprot:XP_003883131.1 Peptidylprolyl isomerase D (Cyclophilin D),related [Neospora caninum Liverpool]
MGGSCQEKKAHCVEHHGMTKGECDSEGCGHTHPEDAHSHSGCCGGHEPATVAVDPDSIADAGEEMTQGDKGVFKKILKEGDGPTPQPGEEVVVHYTGTLLDGTKFDSSRDRDSPFKFIIGEGQVISGWDLGVMKMKRGERAMLTIQPGYGYGASGSPPVIPPNAVLKFDVELLDSHPKPKDKWEMNVGEKLEGANAEKERGNEAFKKGNYAEAAAAYREGLDYFSYVENWSDEEREQQKRLELPLRLNLATCCNRLGEYSEAIEQTTKALEIDPESSKGRFRRGVARMAVGLLDEARHDFVQAAKLDPKNVEIRRELEKCKKKIEEVRAKEKSAFGNIFKKVDLYTEKQGIRNVAKCPKVYMDIKVGDKEPKRVVFALYNDTVPKTAENFRALCTGEKGEGTKGKPLCFKNSLFHRIIPGFMMQGGDFTNGDGTGGESIYGPQFNDEKFVDQHTGRGQLSMANCGPNTNSSQFFITFGPAPHLDGKHVVFGEVVEGQDVLDEVENVETDKSNDRPTQDVQIVDCGEVKC